MRHGPLVSCFMNTSGGPRFHRLVRSVADYCRQTYDRKELVIVADRMSDLDFRAIRQHCRSLSRHDIRLVRPNKELSLGTLRNLAVRRSRGDVVCQWDDDDYHHPLRLEAQLSALRRRGGGALYLDGIMHVLEPYRVMYWMADTHPATLMAYKRDLPAFPEVGENSQLGECAAVREELDRVNASHRLRDVPYLYSYVFHGNNTVALRAHLSYMRSMASPAQMSRLGRRLGVELSRTGLDRYTLITTAPF